MLSAEALADMHKLQLSQQQARAPAAKGVPLNTGCSSASEDFDDEDRIRACSHAGMKSCLYCIDFHCKRLLPGCPLLYSLCRPSHVQSC